MKKTKTQPKIIESNENVPKKLNVSVNYHTNFDNNFEIMPNFQ